MKLSYNLVLMDMGDHLLPEGSLSQQRFGGGIGRGLHEDCGERGRERGRERERERERGRERGRERRRVRRGRGRKRRQEEREPGHTQAKVYYCNRGGQLHLKWRCLFEQKDQGTCQLEHGTN